MTAVEWLIEHVGLDLTNAWKKEIEIALIMEKQQIKDAYNQGYRDSDGDLSGKDISLYNDADLYYNETFKKDKL